MQNSSNIFNFSQIRTGGLRHCFEIAGAGTLTGDVQNILTGQRIKNNLLD